MRLNIYTYEIKYLTYPLHFHTSSARVTWVSRANTLSRARLSDNPLLLDGRRLFESYCEKTHYRILIPN